MIKKKNTKTKVLKIISLIFAVAVVFLGVLELTSMTHFINKEAATPQTTQTSQETINYNPATPEEMTQVETAKTDDDKIKDAQAPTTPVIPADKNVVISSAEQSSNKDVVIKTQLYGIGWQKCTLTLTLGDKKVVKTADTLYQASFSTCLGFSVPYSDLGAVGTWKADLVVLNSDNQAHNASSVQVKVDP